MKSVALSILGTISILISYALVQVSLMALSEPLFILLILLFIYHFDKFRSKQDYTSLFLLSIWASLACLTRYTGIVIILTGIILILTHQKSNFKKKILQSLVFILITVLPIGIWIIRNYFISGTTIGQRAESSYSLSQNLRFFYDTILLGIYLPIQYLFI
ncbi:MAG: glycosyltransferase family 39 protein [Ignavibacteriales bacterium]|nr:glycosyltransferase family 39 protein [Ignavibacteriales bacterium]